MLATFISISRISTARHPSGFEIRCKKNVQLIKPWDLQSRQQAKKKRILNPQNKLVEHFLTPDCKSGGHLAEDNGK